MITPLLRQIFVASAPQLAALSSGGVMGYPTVLLHQFRSNDSSIQVDLDTATWIASVPGLAGIPSLLMPPIMQLKGRKFAFNMSCVLVSIGWIIAFMAESSLHILLAELFLGFGIKSLLVVSYLSISEMVGPKHRNLFLLSYSVSQVLGIALVHLLGRFYHWKTISMILNAPIVLAFIIACSWPETPSWLAYKKKFDECEKAFVWLRGSDEGTLNELHALMNSHRDILENEQFMKEDESHCLLKLSKKIRRRDFYFPIVLMFILLTTYYWSGSMVLLIYAMDLIEKTTQSKDAAFIGMMVIDLVTVIGVGGSSIFLKHFNNKPVLMYSSFISVLFMSGACVVSYLQSIDYVAKDSLLCVYFLVGFMLASGFGSYNIPFTMSAELIPVKHKGLGGALYAIFACTLYSSSLKLSPYLIRYIDLYGTFLVYIVTVVSCLLFLWKYLPETKNRTLQEIEDHYNRRRIEWTLSNCDNAASISLVTSK